MGVFIGGTKYDYSAMQGPCPSGFHIPTKTEFTDLYTALYTLLGNTSPTATDFGTYLKMPCAGTRYNQTAEVGDVGSEGFYWTCTGYSAIGAYCPYIYSTGSNINTSTGRARGNSIRPFRDGSIAPDNTWTMLFDGSSIATGAGVFYNATDGIISISADGSTWITISDKNAGATTVYNYGDTMSQSNCGNYYQRGNCYGFPFTGSVTTSSTQVDASTYGPGNYYESSTFITAQSGDWDTVTNDDLWGGETGMVINTGEISNVYIGEYSM